MEIDAVSISQGELYNILLSRDRTGRQVKVAAAIHHTKAEDLILALSQLAESLRNSVKEVTSDMSMSMVKVTQ
jgi:hypothetical protein